MTAKASDDSAPNEAITSRKRQSGGIAAWPEDERPRERLLARGPDALTDAELLAIVLRIGVEGKNAIELGRELIRRFGSLQAMMSAPLSAWDDIKGLGNAKKAQLVAALELGRRVALPTTREETYLKSTAQAADYFAARLRGLAEEHFRVVYLNRRGRLLNDSLIAKGTVNTVHPPVRSIVARALQTNASVLIAAHNHPSGAAEPSTADKELTRDLIAACHPLGIAVLDHLIVAEGEYFSFADTGLLRELSLATLTPLPIKA
ncbi:MAG: DNA repair protein RadC [Chloroflexi bacterium]|nr:DNA repair protein RadC [Chloroflexota bacterium]